MTEILRDIDGAPVYEVDLLDYGTLDTVLRVHCLICGHTWEESFAMETAAPFRDKDGVLDLESFVESEERWIECPNCEEG